MRSIQSLRKSSAVYILRYSKVFFKIKAITPDHHIIYHWNNSNCSLQTRWQAADLCKLSFYSVISILQSLLLASSTKFV